MKKTYNKPSITIKKFDVTNAIMSDYAAIFNGQNSVNKVAM